MPEKPPRPHHFPPLHGKWKFFSYLITMLVILAAVLFIAPKLFNDKFSTAKVMTINENSLRKAIGISELSTVDFTYNAVATAHDPEKLKVYYHVAYEGIVKAGIDFNTVMEQMEIDQEQKIITVTLPPVQIFDCTVNAGTLDYIFIKDKYDQAEVSAEAYQLCQKDLQEKAAKEPELEKLAESNAASAIRGLIEPWVKQIDSEYTLIIKSGDGHEI